MQQNGSLEAGINPSLLYNSINLIRWIVQLMSLLLRAVERPGYHKWLAVCKIKTFWKDVGPIFFFLNYTSVIFSECFGDSRSPSTASCVTEISCLFFEIQPRWSWVVVGGGFSGEIGHSREMLWKHHEDAVAFFTPQITCDTSFKTWGAVTDGNSCYGRGDKYAGQSWWQEDFWG